MINVFDGPDKKRTAISHGCAVYNTEMCEKKNETATRKNGEVTNCHINKKCKSLPVRTGNHFFLKKPLQLRICGRGTLVRIQVFDSYFSLF